METASDKNVILLQALQHAQINFDKGPKCLEDVLLPLLEIILSVTKSKFACIVGPEYMASLKNPVSVSGLNKNLLFTPPVFMTTATTRQETEMYVIHKIMECVQATGKPVIIPNFNNSQPEANATLPVSYAFTAIPLKIH